MSFLLVPLHFFLGFNRKSHPNSKVIQISVIDGVHFQQNEENIE